jgi:hypothetical protein
MDSILAGMARHRRQDLTRISKRGFEYGVSHDPTDFEHFYHHMHVPHITGRFQERARLVSHAAMRDIFQKSDELIVVKYRGRLAAAGLGLPRQHGQTYSLLQLGIDPDGAQEAKQDIVLALYWHAIRRTHAQGLRRIDFGGTPARLGDGLFNFKRRWGMRFERDVTLHTMWTLIMGRNLPAPLIRHLNELALIVEAGKEYRCLACDGVAAGLSEPELAERQHAAARAGLDGLLIITPGREASRLTAPLREPLAAA